MGCLRHSVQHTLSFDRRKVIRVESRNYQATDSVQYWRLSARRHQLILRHLVGNRLYVQRDVLLRMSDGWRRWSRACIRSIQRHTSLPQRVVYLQNPICCRRSNNVQSEIYCNLLS